MRLSISRPRRPRARLMGSPESAICCISRSTKRGTTMRPSSKLRLDQVGDAAVNDDAGVEQQQIVRLVLRREADVGDDEREILLVAAHGEDDADVAEAQEQAEPDEPAGVVRRRFRTGRNGRSAARRAMPSSRPKVVAEKARSEKPLSISSMAISSQPKPKPMTMPTSRHAAVPTNSGRTWLMA